MKIRGVAEALAVHLSWDVGDVRENRYHYGKTGTLQIFTVGHCYLTACKSDRRGPVKCHDDSYNFNWECVEKDLFGWNIYSYDPSAVQD